MRLPYLALDPSDTEQEYLRVAYDHFQGSQVYARQALFIPQYLLEKADQAELYNNWVLNMIEVPVDKVPQNAM